MPRCNLQDSRDVLLVLQALCGFLVLSLLSTAAGRQVDEAVPAFDQDGAVEAFYPLERSAQVQKRSIPDVYQEGQEYWPVNKRNFARVPVLFKCRRSQARCVNGGLGPKVTMRDGKPICVCMCPYGYTQPQCKAQWWVNKT